MRASLRMNSSYFALRSASIAALLLATPTDAADRALPMPGGRLQVSQRGAATVLTVIRDGRTARVALPLEEGITAGSLQATRIVGLVGDRGVILATDYASRPRGGAHMCGAGTEVVLRVVALRPSPRQTFAQRVASCWRTIEAGDIGWNTDTRELTIERTTFEASEPRDRRTVYRVTPDGTVLVAGAGPRP